MTISFTNFIETRNCATFATAHEPMAWRLLTPVLVTFLNRINDPPTKLHWKWLAHQRILKSATRKGNYKITPHGNPESEWQQRAQSAGIGLAGFFSRTARVGIGVFSADPATVTAAVLFGMVLYKVSVTGAHVVAKQGLTGRPARAIGHRPEPNSHGSVNNPPYRSK